MDGICRRKRAMLVVKSERQQMTDRMELPNQEKRKCTRTWEYWKLTPSNK